MAVIPSLHQGDYPDMKTEELMGHELQSRRGQDKEFGTGVGEKEQI